MLIFQIPIDRINQLMTYEGQWSVVGLGESGESYLVGSDSLLRSQSRFFIEDKNGYLSALKQSGISQQILDQIAANNSAIGLQPVESVAAKDAIAGRSGIKLIKDYRNVDVLSAYAPIQIAGVNWGILSEIDVAEAMQDKDEMTTSIWLILVTITIILLPLTVVGSYLVGKGISTPIKNFIKQVDLISSNKDLTGRVSYTKNDELMALATSFNQLLASLQAILNTVEQMATTLHKSTESMLLNMESTTKETVQQSDSSDGVAVATNELLATIQEVARSASSAADTVNSTSLKCQESTEVATHLEHEMERLNKQMKNASVSIEKLALESKSIGSVLDVIQGIAEQTNLLALNAAIEAARAGELGRGFAVVADEVRTLASRTQQSTEDIRQKISGLQQETVQAVKTVNSSSELANSSIAACSANKNVLAEVVLLVESLSEMNIQIATASEEQTVVVGDINKNITEIADTSQKISDKAQVSMRDVTQLGLLVENIEQQMSEFKL